MTPFDASVRLPSHASPPFRARQWQNWCNSESAGAPGYVNWSPANRILTFSLEWGASIATFQGAEPIAGLRSTLVGRGTPFPDGMRGVLSLCSFSARTNLTSQSPTANLKLSLYRNGVLVSGYVDLWSGVTRQIVSADGRTIIAILGAESLVPVHLEGGDRLDLELTQFATAVSPIGSATVGGWFYPEQVAGDAGSIRQTAADPRAQRPLG